MLFMKKNKLGVKRVFVFLDIRNAGSAGLLDMVFISYIRILAERMIIMTEQELLAFISRIISTGQEKNVNLSLKELRQIMENDNVREEYLTVVSDLIDVSKEAAELGNKKKGKLVTMEELSKSIRDGRERIKRASWC